MSDIKNQWEHRAEILLLATIIYLIRLKKRNSCIFLILLMGIKKIALF